MLTGILLPEPTQLQLESVEVGDQGLVITSYHPPPNKLSVLTAQPHLNGSIVIIGVDQPTCPVLVIRFTLTYKYGVFL